MRDTRRQYVLVFGFVLIGVLPPGIVAPREQKKKPHRSGARSYLLGGKRSNGVIFRSWRQSTTYPYSPIRIVYSLSPAMIASVGASADSKTPPWPAPQLDQLPG